MKTLVIGGMHGNEPLGLELAKKLTDNPTPDVDVVIGSPYAAEVGLRYGTQDLNRSFPGNPKSAIYEDRRAAKILELTKDYDLVLDFHNTHCPDNDCGFVGETADPRLSDILSRLGLKRMVIVDYDCVNKYAPNCLSIEISLNSELMDAELWFQRIGELLVLKALPENLSVERYKFLSRITLEDKDRLGLGDMNLAAFQALPPELTAEFGQTQEVYAIFINDAYTPYNYGALVTRTDV